MAQTLKYHSGVDITNSMFIGQLVRSFKIERPRSLKTMPRWDLVLVLNALLEAPFEPLKTAELKMEVCVPPFADGGPEEG